MRPDAINVYTGSTRTTVDLRPDLHARAMSLARDRRMTLSEAVNELLARVLEPASTPTISDNPVTGLPLVRLGRVVTVDEVRELDDE
jgi:predicted transcriptional regulator